MALYASRGLSWGHPIPFIPPGYVAQEGKGLHKEWPFKMRGAQQKRTHWEPREQGGVSQRRVEKFPGGPKQFPPGEAPPEPTQEMLGPHQGPNFQRNNKPLPRGWGQTKLNGASKASNWLGKN